MKVKKYTTQPTALGITLYFDVNGNKVGESRPRGLFDRLDYYDRHGNFKGYSEISPLGQRIYYDAQGNKTGTSGPGLLESTIYYDNSGNKMENPDNKNRDIIHPSEDVKSKRRRCFDGIQAPLE